MSSPTPEPVPSRKEPAVPARTGLVGALLAVLLGWLVASVAIGAPVRVQDYYPALDILGRGVTPATDTVPYYTSSTAASSTPLTAAGRALLDDASAAAQRDTLDVVPGTDVQAQDPYLQNVADLSTSGFVVRRSAGGAVTRSIVLSGPGWGSILEASGESGNPTLDLDNDLDSLASLTGTSASQWASRTGTSSWTLSTPTYSDVGAQQSDTELTALAGLTSAADKAPYFTGSGTAGVYDLSSYTRTLTDETSQGAWQTALGIGSLGLQSSSSVTITGGSITGITDLAVADGGTGASTPANARTNLGVAIGSDVLAYDAGLTSLETCDTAADLVPYTTAANTWSTVSSTSYGRGGLSLANAAAARSYIGTVIGTDVQAYDAELAAVAGTTSAADKGLYYTGSGTAGTYDLTSYARTLLDDTTAGAWRTTLGLGTIATQDASSVAITGGSATLTGTLVWPQSTAPSQTAEGSVAWDTNDDAVTVGDGTNTLRLVAYQELITSTGTWTAPSHLRGSSLALVECWGGGGGGGSGRRGAAGEIRAGGGGGGAGGYAFARSGIVSDYTGLTVTMGAAGTGGAARTADNTNGASGTAGGTTSWGSLVIASGGWGGRGGTTAGGNSVSPGAPSVVSTTSSTGQLSNGSEGVLHGAGGVPATNNALLLAGGDGYGGVAGGGGAGGGKTAANAVVASGAGGDSWTGVAAPAGTSGDGTAGTAGGDRRGGSGGGYGVTAAGGAGGAGGAYGGGAGGGAGSDNGFDSGAGGTGGTAACRITVYQWLLGLLLPLYGLRWPTRRTRRSS